MIERVTKCGINSQRNDRGFSLIEMTVVTAITSVLILGSLYSLVSFQNRAQVVQNSAMDVTDMNLLKSILPRYLGMAVNLDWMTGGVVDVAAGRGSLAIFESGFDLTLQPVVPIGLYLREVGVPNSANTTGALAGTALFFRNPTPTSPGELAISTSTTTPGPKTLAYGNRVFSFTNIVEFKMEPADSLSGNGDPVRTVSVEIVRRKFYQGQPNNWCPQSVLDLGNPSCEGLNLNFRDIKNTVYINMYNNIISDRSVLTFDGNVKEETIFGSMYFFKPVRAR